MSDQDKLARLEDECAKQEASLGKLCQKMVAAAKRFDRGMKKHRQLEKRIAALWGKICQIDMGDIEPPSGAKGGESCQQN